LLINKDRLVEVAKKNDLDVLVAATKENVLYCTEYWSLSQWTSSDVQVYAVIPVELSLKATLVTPMSDIDLVTEEMSQIDRVVPYGNFHFETESTPREGMRRLREIISTRQPTGSPIEALASAIKEGGFEEARIGLDEGVLHSDLLLELGKLLPRANLIRANSIFVRTRMIKTEEEIRRLRKATAITEKAMMTALESASEGTTEKDMAIEFEKALTGEGARPDFTVLVFGERTALPNGQPSGRKLRKGDAIRFDIGCVYEYYHSDISRMAVLGSANDKLRKYYQAVLQGHKRGLEIIKPGVQVSLIFHEIVRTVRQNGIPQFKRHHCGHGIGIEGYDLPLVSPSSNDILEKGMVLCIEPPYYELGWGGIQVEDTVVVTENRPEFLTSTKNELMII